MTVGEAAIRSSRPWIDCLRRGGFKGIVVRWGDEILIPSTDLDVSPSQFAKVDAVRFGWRADPTEHLASQKEWFIAERDGGRVVSDISRQSLSSLNRRLDDARRRDIATETYVNLGSFAASHDFLAAACDAFGSHMADDVSAANWDPYFWQALQCDSPGSWQAHLHLEEAEGRSGARDLIRRIPDFFDLVLRFRKDFERRTGRQPIVSVLDFGETYWIDVGNHAALSNAMADIFAPTEHGSAIRAFLGLPESLAAGANLVLDSQVDAGCNISSSIIIGSEISDAGSSIEGAIVLGSKLGRLVTSGPAAIIWSRAGDLRFDGPNSIAFRVDASRCRVGDGESVATLLLDGGPAELRYNLSIGAIDSDIFNKPILDNMYSFAEAAMLMARIDPRELHRSWRKRIGRG